MADSTAADLTTETPTAVFDYNRTIVAYHGTNVKTAERLAAGVPFGPSTNDDDWLGHGIYFWEYAPQQAWAWARQKHPDQPAVIGAMIRLGRCLDLLDPGNLNSLRQAHEGFLADVKLKNRKLPRNANSKKFLDCAVFQYLFAELDANGYQYETCRAVFVPMERGKMPRVWDRSGVFKGGHIQVTVRSAANIIAAWSVRKDGRYGKD